MYVTLSDFSTYDTDAFFVVLNKAGESELGAVNDMKNVDGENFEAIIPLSEMIAAYNQVHGTCY